MSSRSSFDLVTSAIPPGLTLIEASAGTGKTYAIAGLFVRLVLEGLTVRQILVTTFTEAATAELRARIRTQLRQAWEIFAGVGCEPFSYLEDLRDQYARDRPASQARLEAALRSFDEATITTIHGFCHAALREHALESGELFDAELLTEDAALRRELAEDFWRQTFYPAAPVLAALARAAKLSPDKFADAIRDTARQPLARLQPAPDATALSAVLAAWQELRRQWPGWAVHIRELFSRADAWANTPYNRPDRVGPLLDAAEAALTGEAPTASGLDALAHFTRSALAEATKKRGPGAPSHPFFEACEQFATAGDHWQSTLLSTLAAWARQEGERRRRANNQLSFDDLLTRLYSALRGPNGPALAGRLRARFTAALIDEFQDTDGVQTAIFEQVFGDGQSRLVLIGDPKQAIYSFRGADIFSYLHASRQAARQYDLPANHRSEHALVAAVNHLFARHQRPFYFEDIRFHPVLAKGRAEDTPLRFAGERPPRLRFWFWEPAEGQDLTAAEADRQIPMLVAGEITRLLAGGTTLGDRAVRPSDFAILVRTNEEAGPIRAALAALGIPAAIQSGDSVFASAEARELRVLLAALATPSREGLVRAALGGDLLAWDAAALDRLDDAAATWEEQLQLFQLVHTIWQQHGFMPAFRHLLRVTHLRVQLLARPEGERRLTNLLHLAELLHAAAAEQCLGLEGLLHWFERQLSDRREHRAEHELRLERDEAAVQVLTLHKSKGLEFNIVFCPSLWRSTGRSGRGPQRAHGPAGELVLDFGSAEAETLASRANDEALAEDLRLLYVALTRARHHCTVLWGKFQVQSGAALAWLLHAPQGAAGRTALADLIQARSSANLRADLENIAASSAGSICILPPPNEPAAPLGLSDAPGAALSPRRFHGHIDRGWQVSSFSSLAEHGQAPVPDEAPDRDDATPRVAETAALTGIHAFPRGRKSGTCLHEIFELLDFADLSGCAELVAGRLTAYGFGGEHREEVCAMVQRALDSDLAAGQRLLGLPKKQRLSELEFVLQAAPFSSADLARTLGDGAPDLTFEPRRGLLKGYIDLVAAIEGRYFLVDWKSNWLGPGLEDYGPGALADAMRASRYGLQYHLYTLALHRYLRGRLRGYRYAEHFGGAAYLFLRGLDPARPDLGVFRARPDEATIDALDRLFLP